MGCIDVDMVRSYDVNGEKIEVWGILFCMDYFFLWLVRKEGLEGRRG